MAIRIFKMLPVMLLAAGVSAASAQMGDGSPAVAMGSGRAVRGTVTAAAADHLSVKTDAGEIYEVVVTANTQVRKGRDQVKLTDVHVGDGIGAVGEIDAAKKTVHALMLQIVDADSLKKAREAMGKTFISGTVTAIDDVKITIKRTDDVVQVIQVDEDTSFRKGARGMQMALAADGTGAGMTGARGQRGGATGAAPGAAAADNAESLTLADVKVGSVVAGPGTIKSGVFVPATLSIGEGGGGQRQRRRPDGAGAGATAPPSTTTPASTGTEPK
jgi:hypothetical protein